MCALSYPWKILGEDSSQWKMKPQGWIPLDDPTRCKSTPWLQWALGARTCRQSWFLCGGLQRSCHSLPLHHSTLGYTTNVRVWRKILLTPLEGYFTSPMPNRRFWYLREFLVILSQATMRAIIALRVSATCPLSHSWPTISWLKFDMIMSGVCWVLLGVEEYAYFHRLLPLKLAFPMHQPSSCQDRQSLY